MGSELSSEYYDQFHGVQAHYGAHYRKSAYYRLFRSIVRELREVGATRILEVGCGSGVLAQMIQEQLPDYDVAREL
ncbi:MAG: hypothetical protein ABI369_09175, partial [Acetobacteraceae bacterium]